MSFLQKLGMLPTDILALQRIVGFCDGTDTLKISDIMTKLKERADKRSLIEIETLKTLATEFKAKNYSIQDAFAHLDADDSGHITLEELEDRMADLSSDSPRDTTENAARGPSPDMQYFRKVEVASIEQRYSNTKAQ